MEEGKVLKNNGRAQKDDMKSVPLHVEVENRLKERITNGEAQPGDKLGTELELANEFGVSRSTIRHALISLQSEGYIERIHGRGTFVAEPADYDRTQNSQTNQGIYIIVPHLTNEFTGNIVVGAQEVLFKEGYNLSVYATYDSQEREKEYIQSIIDRGASGVILHPTKAQYYNLLVSELIQREIPLVMTGRHYEFVNSSYVEADNYQGAYEAVSYLISLGHVRIGLVSKPPMFETSLQDRVRGYIHALADHGLPMDRDLMWIDLEDNRSVYWQNRDEKQKSKINKQLVNYLEQSPKMTAVVALNDLIAADLIQAAKSCGKTVGSDLSIVGFDNVTLSASLDPPLTTVDCPTIEIGRRAANAIVDHIRNAEQNLTKEHLPMKLVIRKSCSHV